jgi:Pectate lyase superfamily protein
MGTTVNGIYVPSDGETGWGTNVSNNQRRLADLAVNVKAKGATGDGTTDDSAAISSAITEANSGGGIVYFPSGSYKIGSTITLGNSKRHVLFIGANGPQDAMVHFQKPGGVKIISPGTPNPAFLITPNDAGPYAFENLSFRGAGIGVKLAQTSQVKFTNCGFESTSTDPAFQMDDTFWVWFKDCAFRAVSTSVPSCKIRSVTTGGNNASYLIRFEDCIFDKYGVQYEQVNTTAIVNGKMALVGCTVENSTSPVLEVTGGVTENIEQITLEDCHVYDPASGSPPIVSIGATAGTITVAGLYIRGCGETDDKAIEVKTGGSVNGALVESVRGAWYIQTTAGATSGSSITMKEAGWQIIAPTGGPAGAPTETSVTGASGPAIRLGIPGDANAKAGIDTDGKHYWGAGGGTSGWDTNLYRQAANQLKSDDTIIAADGVQTKYKAGTPVDGDFATTPPDGTLVVDSTGNKIWARVGGTWKGVVIA